MADLIGSVLMFPLLPLKGVMSLLEVLQREAEREKRASDMRRLHELDEALHAGQISAEEHERAQEAVLNSMIGTPAQGRER